MIFALAHATLGLLLAAFAAWSLRHRSADARCWAWRLGLLKGPLALLLAVPILYTSPVHPGGEGKDGIGEIVGSSFGVAPQMDGARGRTVAPRVSGEGQDGSSFHLPKPDRRAATPLPLPLIAYVLGVVAVLFTRLHAARRPHRAMPRVVGVLRPRIVIPGGLAPGAAAIALAHETAHVRRRDPQWSLIADLICAGLWFAPPVWLCARAMRLESEAACDAAALQETGTAKTAYARLLLAFAGPAPAVALGGPARRLARRIQMLERNPKPLPRLAVAVLAVAGLTVLLPWRAEARPVAPQAPKRNAAASAKTDKTRPLMEEVVRIRLEQTRAEVRNLEKRLRELQGDQRSGFDPKEYRLVQKRVADAQLRIEQAHVAHSLAFARQANRQAVRAQLDAVRQAQAEAAKSLELARRESIQAKAQREIEIRLAQQAQRDAVEAMRRAHDAAKQPVHGSMPSMEASDYIMNAGKVILKGDARVDGVALDTLPAPSKPGEPVKVVELANGAVWNVYRTGDKAPFQYRVERAPGHFLDYGAQKVYVMPKAGMAHPSRRISVSRWNDLSVGGPALEEGKWKTLRNADGSTWTLIREKGGVPPTYRLEYRLEAPSDEFPNHVIPREPLSSLTVDGTTWTIHASVNRARTETVSSTYSVKIPIGEKP